MIRQPFGGVSQDGISWAVDYDKVLYELARWLLPVGICLLAEGVLLLLGGLTFLAGFAYMGAVRFMFGMWGMYFQSRWYYSDRGVSVLLSLIIEGILIMLGYMTGEIITSDKNICRLL